MVTQSELEERQDFAVSLVLEAESLTADLVDDEATVLLDWGCAEARAAAAATGHVEDADRARQMIEDALVHLRRAMKKINDEAADLDATSRLATVRSLVAAQAQSFSILDFIEQPEEAPAGEAEPHAQRTLTAEEQPREGGFMARLLSWLGLN